VAADEAGTSAAAGPAAPWSAIPFPYPRYTAALLPVPPARPRTPKRYIFSAVAVLAVGLALAATSIATSQPVSGKPVPPTAAALRDEAARAVWRAAPVDAVLPPSIDLAGGDKYLRLGVAEPASCDILPAAFRAELASVAPGTSCVKVLRAGYVDATQTVLATVGVVVVGGPADARDKVWRQWTPDADAKRADMMPSVYAVPGTVGAKFGDAQRIAWRSRASADGTYLVYAVSGFVDGRAGSTPDQIQHAAGKALAVDSPPVQAGMQLPEALARRLQDAGAKR
jgi:hypothetical protein